MVAGGVGLAPFAALAEALRARGVKTTLFYGARSGAELFYLDFFRGLGAELVLTTDPADFFWSGYRFSRFIPVGEYVVRGFSNRYRQAGVGAPLAADLGPVDSGPAAEAGRVPRAG